MLSKSPHHKRFIVIYRDFNRLSKVTWIKVIRACMKKLQSFEYVCDPIFGRLGFKFLFF
jgi:hypothetical protein